MSLSRLFGLTALAMIAFAANSVLARLALIDGDIGPLSFTLLRLLSGALILCLIIGVKRSRNSGNWKAAFTLLGYAICFSLAYISLPAGTGALILFGTVQVTMIGAGLISGERLSTMQIMGALIAMGGLVYLLSPGLSAPPLLGAILMTLSGIGWGAYSLYGRTSQNPTQDTAGNFWRTALLAACVCIPVLIFLPETAPSRNGIIYALSSGAITSGLGYVIWYMALKELNATRAGLSQLTVPVLAAFGGILFLGEAITPRLIIASVIILGGVALGTAPRKPYIRQ